MVKLGMALAKLKRANEACQAFAELDRKFPDMPANVRQAADRGRSAASCAHGGSATVESEFVNLLTSFAHAQPKPKIETRDRPQRTSTMKLAMANQIAALIKTRVEANWSVPAGVRDASDLVVTIRIRLGRDGAVQSAEILDANYAEDPNFRAMAESARRAVQKASPIKEVQRFNDDYNEWRVVTMTFRPPV